MYLPLLLFYIRFIYTFEIAAIAYYLLCFSMSFLRELLPLCGFQGALVGSSGLEPPTSRLSGVRSNLLSYEPIPWWR